MRTAVEARGDVQIELSYGAYDDLLAGAQMGDWSAAADLSATDIAADDAGAQFTSTTTDFTAESLVLGQWIKVDGFADPGLNTYYRVTSIAANALGVDPAPAAAEAAGNTVTVKGSLLKNGTAAKSFTLEKQFADVGEFVSFTGMRVGQLSLAVQPGQIITGSFSFQGERATAAGASVGTGQPTAAPGNDVLNAIDHVTAVREGGQATTLDVTGITLQLQNNLRSRQAMANLGPVGVGLGRVGVTGSFEAYFETRALYEKYLSFAETSLSFRVVDGAGNAYVFDLPRLKFTDGQVVAGGNDQDVLAQLSFTAVREAVGDMMLGISRFPAA